MNKNILFCLGGIILGFFVGFLSANSFTKPALPVQNAAGTTRPLDPSQSGALPPNHPSVDGASGQGGAPAATSAQAQSAMAKADANPRDFDAQMSAAVLFYQLEDKGKATLYLERALALKPDDPDALTGMGHTKADSGDFEAAESFFTRAAAQRPSDADVRAEIGNTYFQRTPPDYDRAIAEYRKALEIDARNEAALYGIAAAAIRKQDKETARDAIEKFAAVTSSPALTTSLRERLSALP